MHCNLQSHSPWDSVSMRCTLQFILFYLLPTWINRILKKCLHNKKMFINYNKFNLNAFNDDIKHLHDNNMLITKYNSILWRAFNKHIPGLKRVHMEKSLADLFSTENVSLKHFHEKNLNFYSNFQTQFNISPRQLYFRHFLFKYLRSFFLLLFCFNWISKIHCREVS